MKAEAALDLAITKCPELSGLRDRLNKIYEVIEKAAREGETSLRWCNGGDLGIGQELPTPWPSASMRQRLREDGYAVVEHEYPDSGLEYLTVMWG